MAGPSLKLRSLVGDDLEDLGGMLWGGILDVFLNLGTIWKQLRDSPPPTLGADPPPVKVSPTAELGVLDDFSKPDRGFYNIKISR